MSWSETRKKLASLATEIEGVNSDIDAICREVNELREYLNLIGAPRATIGFLDGETNPESCKFSYRHLDKKMKLCVWNDEEWKDINNCSIIMKVRCFNLIPRLIEEIEIQAHRIARDVGTAKILIAQARELRLNEH